MKRIAFITDIHLNEQFPIDNHVNPTINLETVLADIVKQKITEIVFGGDIGEATSHNYFFAALKQFSLTLILGNHDKFEHVKEHFNLSIDSKELYYKVEDGNYIYIYLDTSSDEISIHQLQWLEAELNTSKKIVVFIHHPILQINTPVDSVYPLKNRDQLKTILLGCKNHVTIFCGITT